MKIIVGSLYYQLLDEAKNETNFTLFTTIYNIKSLQLQYVCYQLKGMKLCSKYKENSSVQQLREEGLFGWVLIAGPNCYGY